MGLHVVTWATHLGHHASPSNDISFTPFCGLFFKGSNSIEQRIEMFIGRIIQLLKRIESEIQICRQVWRVIVRDR